MEGGIRYMKTREAAELLGLSPRTLETYRWRGGGPAFSRSGSNVRYLRSHVVAWTRPRFAFSTLAEARPRRATGALLCVMTSRGADPPGSAATRTPRQVPESGQPRRAGPAQGGHGRAPQPDLHRRKHRARLSRMDTPVAIKAPARELACLIYLMVTEGQEYVEQGIDAYEKRRLNRRFSHLDRQAQKLGFQLIQKTQGERKKNPIPSII